ncbi:MAG TPA: hypothetical protein VJP77_04250 [Planctomycetota bacterium]|nr:hypothetical protein [Planctomycetota bacterium]
MRGTLTIDSERTLFDNESRAVAIPHEKLIAASTRLEGADRVWFFTYLPDAETEEVTFIVNHREDPLTTEALVARLRNVSGFEQMASDPSRIEFRRPVVVNAASIAAAAKSDWSEFDQRLEIGTPSLVIHEATVDDLRAISLSLSMVHDDELEAGRISLMYVGDGWLWLAPNISASLPGDEELELKRTHSSVEQGGTCAEVMTALLPRSALEEMASTGFAMEVPLVGIVRVDAIQFAGLLKAFDEAKAEHGIGQ